MPGSARTGRTRRHGPSACARGPRARRGSSSPPPAAATRAQRAARRRAGPHRRRPQRRRRGRASLPRRVDRAALWRRVLVDRPRGWRPGGAPGSWRATAEDVDALGSDVTFLYVGRFTEVKRVPLLIEAFTRARRRLGGGISLVIVGGHPASGRASTPPTRSAGSAPRPCCWPAGTRRRELPDLLRASDVVVLPSVNESFGQVLVEGMACELPAIAVDRGGPAEIVDDGETGWLVAPDDVADLERAIVEAATRRRRAPAPRRARAARRARALHVARRGPRAERRPHEAAARARRLDARRAARRLSHPAPTGSSSGAGVGGLPAVARRPAARATIGPPAQPSAATSRRGLTIPTAPSRPPSATSAAEIPIADVEGLHRRVLHRARRPRAPRAGAGPPCRRCASVCCCAALDGRCGRRASAARPRERRRRSTS